MNMHISEVKLPRLNTIIASQADRNKFIANVKASYEDASDIKVTDNGGLCFDYQVMYGARKGSVLRIPKAAVLKFSKDPDNAELDPKALTTLKAQLDAWVNESIQGEAKVYTEHDKIILLSTHGTPERAKFIMVVAINGLIDETSNIHSAGFTSIRSDVASKLNGAATITSVKADQIISQLVAMVNGTDELTEDLPRLFDDEIILPTGPFIDGYGYTANIASTALDYFGKIEFKIALETDGDNGPVDGNPDDGEPSTPAEPISLESIQLNSKSSIRGKQNTTMELHITPTPSDAEIQSVVWEVEPATGLTLTQSENGLNATLTVNQDFDENTAGDVILTVTVNGTSTITETALISVTAHDALVTPVINFDADTITVNQLVTNNIDFVPYENQDIKSTEFTFSPVESVEVTDLAKGFFRPLVAGQVTVNLKVTLQDDTELTTSQIVDVV